METFLGIMKYVTMECWLEKKQIKYGSKKISDWMNDEVLGIWGTKTVKWELW